MHRGHSYKKTKEATRGIGLTLPELFGYYEEAKSYNLEAKEAER